MKLIVLAGVGSLALATAAHAGALPGSSASALDSQGGAAALAQYYGGGGYGGGYYREPNDSGYRRRQRESYGHDNYSPPRYRGYAPRRDYDDDDDY